eukprot:13410017-Alexandrium_andersonii.AAC.1
MDGIGAVIGPVPVRVAAVLEKRGTKRAGRALRLVAAAIMLPVVKGERDDAISLVEMPQRYFDVDLYFVAFVAMSVLML